MMLWWALYSVACVSLLLHFNTRNAVSGGAALGYFVGLMIAFLSDDFDWLTVANSVTIAAILGTIAELFPGNRKAADQRGGSLFVQPAAWTVEDLDGTEAI
jgi:hypothetical protein